MARYGRAVLRRRRVDFDQVNIGCDARIERGLVTSVCDAWRHPFGPVEERRSKKFNKQFKQFTPLPRIMLDEMLDVSLDVLTRSRLFEQIFRVAEWSLFRG
jgi:hypothetical protein